MSCCPKLLVQISLLFSLVLSALIVVTSFMYGNIWAGVFGSIFFAISVCYACMVWRRIPFAAANLNTGLTAVKRNAGVIIAAYILVVAMFGFAVLWMVALVGVYDHEELCDTTTNPFTGEEQTDCSSASVNNLALGYFFLLLLSLFWTQQVFQVHFFLTICSFYL